MRTLFTLALFSLLTSLSGFSQCEASFVTSVGEGGIVYFLNGSSNGAGGTSQFLWEFGDGSIGDGENPNHFYDIPGTYNACLYMAVYDGENLLCSSTFCAEVTVYPSCPSGIFQNSGEQCGEFNFEIGSFSPGESVLWNMGDGSEPILGGHFLNYTYAESGTYELCANYSSSQCPGITLCTTVEVTPCNNCDLALSGEAIDCDTYVFSILNANVGNVIWNYGDGSQNTGSINADHTYAENGTYIVSATYSGPSCPEGTTVYYTVNVDCITENLCPTTILATQSECGSYLFSLNNLQSADVYWNFGDGTIENGSLYADHTYTENGAYIVVAEFSSSSCPESYALTYTILVDCYSTNDCPNSIWSGAGNECGVMNFEIGSFVEGESVTWYPGDDTGAVEGGHFFSHTYAAPGVYTVCAYYTSSNCPDGVELCASITVEDCSTCTEVNIGLDSYMNAGGPSAIWWMLTNADGLTVDDGVAQYSVEDPFYDQSVCLEDGCYTLTLEGLGVANSQAVQAFLNTGKTVYEQNIEISNDNLIHITFGVNSVCSEPSCTTGTMLFSSNPESGSTNCVAVNILDLATETSVFAQYLTFSPDYQTYLFEPCLADGCYRLTFDACQPYSAGGGLQYNLMINGQNVLVAENIVNQDNYMIQFEFGVNSDCGVTPDECVASFIPIYTNTPGHIEFQNTSTYTGDATWSWFYANGTTSDGFSGNVYYQANAIYTVCLTLTTDNCTDTYCQDIIIENIPTEACELNEVTFTLEASLPLGSFVDDLDLILSSENYPEETIEAAIVNGTVSFTLCLPDGCYEVTAQAPPMNPIEANSVYVTVDGADASLLLGLDPNTQSITGQLGINSDCIDGVSEIDNNWTLYPNPADQAVRLTNTSGALASRIEVLDATGRIVRSYNQTNTPDISGLAAGTYLVRVEEANRMIVLPLIVEH